MFTYAFNKKDDVRIVKEVVQLPPPPPDTGKVTGNVIDRDTGLPVGRAIVEMRDTGMTDLSTNPINGTFTTPDLKAGIVGLYASKEGYTPDSITTTVQAGRTVSTTIALEKESTIGAVYGRVTTLQGNPLSATITAVPLSVQEATSQTGQQATSDPLRGEFFIKLQAGDYAISSYLPGYKAQTKNVHVNKGFKTGVNFTMEAEQLAPPPAVGKKTRVFIEKEKKKIVITEKIFFKLGRSKIMPVSFGILDELADVLIKNQDIKIRIEGYTDSIGRPETNLRLSQERAGAVMKYLSGQGVPSDRMTAKGYGMGMPIADNKTAAGRAENRRVEFVITSQQ
jgi:outer membrane protein OmpA-like peptidoglycan-associated protein